MGKKNSKKNKLPKRLRRTDTWGREEYSRYLESLVTPKNNTSSGKTETFKDRIKVEPKVDNKKAGSNSERINETQKKDGQANSIEKYPENSIIISMGPKGIGKTRYLSEIFGEGGIVRFDVENDEQIPGRLKILQNKLKEKKLHKIIIDCDVITKEVRQNIYDLAKKNHRPVYFILSTIGLEEIKNRLEQIKDHTSDKAENLRRVLKTVFEEFNNKLYDIIQTYESELQENGVSDDDVPKHITTIVHGMNKGRGKSKGLDR